MTVTPARSRRLRHRVVARWAAVVAAAALGTGIAAPMAAAGAPLGAGAPLSVGAPFGAGAPLSAGVPLSADEAFTQAARFAASAPSPTPTPDVPIGTTVFTLAPIAGGILEPGQALTASVTLQNGTARPLAPVEVTLSLGTRPLADRGALDRWLEGDAAAVEVAPVGTTRIDSVEAGGSQTAAITLAADDPALQDLAPGAYPLSAEYERSTGSVTSTSVVVVPDDGAKSVAVLVPITAAPRTEALLTASELATLTDMGGELTAQLQGVEGTNAVLAVDPAIPAAIRALGVAAPEDAVAWLERLESLPNTRFALQFGDADPAVQVETGLARPLAPLSFEPLLQPADFPTPTPTPSATPTPGTTPDATPAAAPSPSPSGGTDQTDTDPTDADPAVPTLDELTAIGGTSATVYWPAAESVTPSSVATLGGDGTDALVVVPGTAVQSEPGARATAGDASLLVYDAGISRALSAAARVDESVLRGAPLAAASAHLSFATGTDAPVLVALDRGADRSNVGLRAAISAVTEYPGATALSLPALVTGAAAPATLVEAEPPATRLAQAEALFAGEAEIASFATILDDPLLLTAVERAEVLQLLGVGWADMPDEAARAVAEHRDETADTLDSVRLLPSPTINLLAAGAGLPFTVRNDLPYEVRVVLYATPNDLRLNVQRTTEIMATPSSNTAVEVPVEARVGNGDVTLDLQLRSPTYVAIGPGTTVEVNVRAEWETVGLVALGIIVGALVILGIVRTILRVRARRQAARDKRVATSDREESAPDADAGPAASGSTPASAPDADAEPAASDDAAPGVGPDDERSAP